MEIKSSGKLIETILVLKGDYDQLSKIFINNIFLQICYFLSDKILVI